MKLIAFFSALVLAAFIFFGCDAKTKEAGDKMAEATKELVKTAITEAADTAKAKAAEAADVAKDIEDKGISIIHALDIIYNSNIYQKLLDRKTGLYLYSPAYIYDYLKEEIK